MKRLSALIVFVLAATALATAQSTPRSSTAEDEAAVRAIVDHWKQTWESFDSAPLKDDYADDADFLNAFGTRFKSSAEILDFMKRVVKRPNVQGRHTTWDDPRVRFLRPDVAIVYRDYRTTGFKRPDGSDMGPRSTHGTWLLTKDAGKWRVVSQLIADDNSTQ